MNKKRKSQKIFVAGSTGAVGKIMCRMLADRRINPEPSISCLKILNENFFILNTGSSAHA